MEFVSFAEANLTRDIKPVSFEAVSVNGTKCQMPKGGYEN